MNRNRIVAKLTLAEIYDTAIWAESEAASSEAYASNAKESHLTEELEVVSSGDANPIGVAASSDSKGGGEATKEKTAEAPPLPPRGPEQMLAPQIFVEERKEFSFDEKDE